jgi:hypothetical protein
MKVSREDEAWVCTGGPRPRKFKYCIERSMTVEISNWLQKTFKGGYGVDYYYSHGEIWFMKGRHETLFLLRWSA